MFEIQRTVQTKKPVGIVSAFLSDFTTSAIWDPHTRECQRISGVHSESGSEVAAVGNEFDNVQRIGPLSTRLRYRVEEYKPGQKIVLASRGKRLESIDSMTFQSSDDGGTQVTYTARLQLHGVAKLTQPLLQRIMEKVADDGAIGMQNALADL